MSAAFCALLINMGGSLKWATRGDEQRGGSSGEAERCCEGWVHRRAGDVGDKPEKLLKDASPTDDRPRPYACLAVAVAEGVRQLTDPTLSLPPRNRRGRRVRNSHCEAEATSRRRGRRRKLDYATFGAAPTKPLVRRKTSAVARSRSPEFGPRLLTAALRLDGCGGGSPRAETLVVPPPLQLWAYDSTEVALEVVQMMGQRCVACSSTCSSVNAGISSTSSVAERSSSPPRRRRRRRRHGLRGTSIAGLSTSGSLNTG